MITITVEGPEADETTAVAVAIWSMLMDAGAEPVVFDTNPDKMYKVICIENPVQLLEGLDDGVPVDILTSTHK